MAENLSTLNKRKSKIPKRYELDYYPSEMIESNSDDACKVATIEKICIVNCNDTLIKLSLTVLTTVNWVVQESIEDFEESAVNEEREQVPAGQYLVERLVTKRKRVC